MRKGKYIQNLTSALTSTGLGLFLVIGLTGCDSSNKCKNTSAQNPKNKEECKNQSSGGTIFPVFNSGYFGSSSTSNYNESHGG